MLIDGKRILLLGAEGCSEMAEEPWLREATDEEKEQFYAEFQVGLDRERPGKWKAQDYNVDGNNRPYWVKVVEDEAPEDIRQSAENGIRRLRLDF